MKTDDLLVGLPGENLVRRGLTDFFAHHCTIESCLIHVARPRFVRAGLVPPDHPYSMEDPEIQLYRLLQGEGGDAYSRYNSLLRELVSFEMCLDGRLQRRKVNCNC